MAEEHRDVSEVDTTSKINELFSLVLQPGEKLKIVTGQRVALNESNVGKPRDNLSPEVFNRLANSVLELGTERVKIATTDKGNPKAPEFEVLAIGEKGPDGKAPTRTLFRQERGAELPTSVNLVGDLLASLIVDAQIEGQQNGFATYTVAHHTIDGESNPFSPSLEGYPESVRGNPYVRSLTLEAFEEGFEFGQKTGKETFPEISVLETEVAKELTTAELIEENGEEWSPSDDPGLDDARYYESIDSSDRQEPETEELRVHPFSAEEDKLAEREFDGDGSTASVVEEEPDVENAIADEILPPSDEVAAQQFWADDMDAWLGSPSGVEPEGEKNSEPGVEDAIDTDRQPPLDAAEVQDAIADEQLSSSKTAPTQPYWDDDIDEWLGDQSQAIDSDTISLSDAAVETQGEITTDQPDLSDTAAGLKQWTTAQETTASVDIEELGAGEDLEPLNEHPSKETGTPLEAESNIEEHSLTDALSDEATTTSPSTAAEQTEGENTVQETQAGNTPKSSNTIAALFESIEQLPEDSPAREIAEKLATELQAHASEIKAREEKAQNRKNWLKEGGSVIRAIQKTAAQTKNSIQAGSVKDAAVGIAFKSVGAIADMSGKGLKAAGQYLKNRAQKVEEYGMAKAAVAIHRKGHSRTGEDSFTQDGYTVAKRGNEYTVLDQKDRAVMTFETNRKGQPINVTQTDAAQKEDKWAVGRIAKNPVILGSSEKEKAYEEKLRAIATVADDLLGESHEADGKNFRVSREDGGIAVSTKTFPSRSAQINTLGEVESNLTRDDLNQIGQSLTIAVDYAVEEEHQTRNKVEMTV